VCRGLYLVEAGFRRLPLPEFWHPVIGAIGFACVGLAVPRALGVGYDTINDILANRLAVGVLAALLVGKALAWWIALGSGTSGGTLAPILLISGAFGALVGALLHEVAPGIDISPGAVALVAMAATFGASTRATFTAIVFAFELTQDYAAILPIMLAAVVADLVAAALLDHGLMTEKLARRGLPVPRDLQPDRLQATPVAAAMTTDVIAMEPGRSVADVRACIETTGHGAFPLVDADGRCVGIVSRTDLLALSTDGDVPVAEVATTDVVTVAPGDTLLTALDRIVTEDVEHLPVVDTTGRLIGICTRTDILRARGHHLSADRPQPGWNARWRRSTRGQ
jgi:CBS domain-containing protein